MQLLALPEHSCDSPVPPTLSNADSTNSGAKTLSQRPANPSDSDTRTTCNHSGQQLASSPTSTQWRAPTRKCRTLSQP